MLDKLTSQLNSELFWDDVYTIADKVQFQSSVKYRPTPRLERQHNFERQVLTATLITILGCVAIGFILLV